MQTNDIINTTTKPTQLIENNTNQPSVQKLKSIPTLNTSSSSSSAPATVTTTVLVLEPKYQHQVYLKTNKTTNLDDYINSKKNVIDVNKNDNNLECIESDNKMEDMIVDSNTTHSLPAKLSPNTSPIRKQSKLQRPLVTASAKPTTQSSESSNKIPVAPRTSAIPSFSRNSFQNKLVKPSITPSSTNATNNLMTTSTPLMNLSNNSIQSKLFLLFNLLIILILV